MDSREKLVTKSDEAFTLLMYENYIGKWKKQGNIKDNEDKQHDGDKEREEGEETDQSVPRERKTPTKAVKGKYTVHNNGTTKYGGWSDKGVLARFNQLYKLVKEDTKCPQAVAMGEKFLEYARYYACSSKQRSTANNAHLGIAIGELANMRRGIVQPAWESDDE